MFCAGVEDAESERFEFREIAAGENEDRSGKFAVELNGLSLARVPEECGCLLDREGFQIRAEIVSRNSEAPIDIGSGRAVTAGEEGELNRSIIDSHGVGSVRLVNYDLSVIGVPGSGGKIGELEFEPVCVLADGEGGENAFGQWRGIRARSIGAIVAEIGSHCSRAAKKVS